MFDSSDTAEYNYDIEIEIEEYKNGYLMTLIPEREWILSSERVYPVKIDPVVETVRDSFAVTTLSEERSSSRIDGDTVSIGGSASDQNRYEALVSFTGSPSNYNNSTVILDATFNMFYLANTNQGNNSSIDLYSVNNSSRPCWKDCGGDNGSSTYISTLSLPETYGGGYKLIEITNLAQTWLNNLQTDGCTGVYPYGIKLKAQNSNNQDSRIFEAYSNTGAYPPYFSITYTNDTDYSLNYAPYKYNNIELSSTQQLEHDPSDTLYNFQNRMNCYAYALQVYYNRELDEGETYYLKPGEFGISYNSTGSNYKQLCNQYSSYDNSGYKLYMDFVEQRMYDDACALEYDIVQLESTQDSFELPTAFNPNFQRVIAMVVGVSGGIKDYHFYVRNGNGTCSNGHGGTCSMWSHKQAQLTISNKKINSSTIILCDANIYNNANAGIYTNYNPNTDDATVRFYTITKDVSIYNSWHGNGDYDECTGTPYRQ